MSMPNLFPFLPVVVLACVLASMSGLSRSATGPTRLIDFGDRRDGVQLRFALDVEHQDVGFEGEADFVVGLADAGEDDLGGVGAGLPCTRYSSPPETTSKLLPASWSSLSRPRLQFAFTE